MRFIKWAGFFVLGLLMLALILAVLNWKSITRLKNTLSLFESDKIVSNFSNMDNAFFHQRLEIGASEAWEEEIRPIPDNVMLEGQAHKLSKVLEELDTTALVIIQDGKLIHESYYLGTEKDDLRISWSVAKSFMSGLYGKAIELSLIHI